MLVKLSIQRTTTHEKFTVEIDDQSTIKDLATLLDDDFESGPAITLKVIHKGKILNHATLVCQIPNSKFEVDTFVILNSNKDKSKYKIKHQTLVAGPAIPIYKKDPPPPFSTVESAIEETKTSPIATQEKELTSTSTLTVEPTMVNIIKEKKDEEIKMETIVPAVPSVSDDVRTLMELGITAERATSALARFGNVEVAANYLLSNNGNGNGNDYDQDQEGDGAGEDDAELGTMMTQADFRTRLLAMMATRYATDPTFAALNDTNPAAALDQFAQELMQNPQGLFPQGAGIGVHFDANYDDDESEDDEDFIPPE